MLLTRKTLWSCCSAALLGACVSSSAIAQSAAAPEKLTDLLTICNDALQFNPEYESARASYYAAQELVPQARGKLLQQIGVRGESRWMRQHQDATYHGAFEPNNLAFDTSFIVKENRRERVSGKGWIE